MNAVNLLPADERRGAAGARTGGAVYGLLGVLALVVIAVSLVAMSGRAVAEQRAELAQVQAQVAQAEQVIRRMQEYSDVAARRARRQQTVRRLAAGRFNWASTLREVARTLPREAWVSSLRATNTPQSSVEGGATDSLRSALQIPALEVLGCSRTHRAVARTVSSLRRISGVQRVSLSLSSESSEDAGGGEGSAGTACRANATQFSLVVFFQPSPATAAATGAQATAATAGSSTP